MSRINALYRWLESESTQEVDIVLAEGLAHAEPDYAQRIVQILLGRRRDNAWAGLVANYDRLSAEARHTLHRHPELLRAGIAAALKTSTFHTRRGALILLAQHPQPRLSYLVADVLRDQSEKVRMAAARVLRVQAEHVFNSIAEARRSGRLAPELLDEQREVAEAVGEAIRTIDIHERREVLELGLWFAKELGDRLWDVLADIRSHCGVYVESRLLNWNNARLAAFLLLALTQRAWHVRAREMLASWNKVSELVALMRNSDLLNRPAVQRALRQVKQPRWFAVNNTMLAQLPPDVRGRLPHWACYLGFSEAERVRFLDAWQLSSLPEVHRAAVYALAAMDTPATTRILTEVATRPCPMNQFAQWYCLGKRLEKLRARERSDRAAQRAGASDSPANPPTPEAVP